MDYLMRRSDTWYFSRRVPNEYRTCDTREYVRISLRTDSRKQAKRLVAFENAKLEQYWAALLGNAPVNEQQQFKRITERAGSLGFPYQPIEQILIQPYSVLLQRLLFLEKQPIDEKKVEAVLGTAPEPVLHLKT